MNARLVAAISAARTARLATRFLRRGGGTALPGLVAERVDPNVVAHLGRQLQRRVFITGTNGKTTTSRMLASVLAAARVPSLHNREGSNLMRGMASTLIQEATLTGAIPRARSRTGIFETDEATMPAATRALQPSVLVFSNLFRDQLDRYGEVDTVAALWREALTAAPRDATIVLNADDPSVAGLTIGWQGPVHWFGLDDPAMTGLAGASDARWCDACAGDFAYDRRYFAHVGWWRCTRCSRTRPETETTGREVRLSLDAASFEEPGLGRVEMHLTGLYNVYNALAAIAAARVLGVPPAAIVEGIAATDAAFGRQEIVQAGSARLRLMLCKNPAGANEIVRLLRILEPGIQVAALLNDRFADGQDVSWIWDVDYELLAGRVARCWAGGTRAHDISLRLEYAGWPERDAVLETPAATVDALTAATGDVFVIATYTAMLDLRAELRSRGYVRDFWEG